MTRAGMWRCGEVRCRSEPPEGLSRMPCGPAASGRAELVLEVDDVVSERDRVVAAGWPLEQDLQNRPCGLSDFRNIDPAGYYLRITSR